MTKKPTPKRSKGRPAGRAAADRTPRRPANTPKAATGRAAKPGSGARPAAEAEAPARLSAIDAAVRVLEEAGTPMRTHELIDRMAKSGLWTSPAGKTPAATLYAAILREITTKGAAARFRKVDRGLFASAAGA